MPQIFRFNPTVEIMHSGTAMMRSDLLLFSSSSSRPRRRRRRVSDKSISSCRRRRCRLRPLRWRARLDLNTDATKLRVFFR